MSTPGDAPPEGIWERIIGIFVGNKFVVLALTGLLIFASLVVSPFDWAPDGMARDPVPVDAIPDIGENQQIVFTSWPGRSPRDMEDQVTYPLTTALLGIPGVRTVRSSSMLGFSTIYVIFEEGVEFYWSRSRVLEKLASLPAGLLPEGVSPALGPDATALGQVFWYTLEGHRPEGGAVGGWELHELRSIQDWTIRPALQSVPGVSEVASVGGYVREYQIDVDPEALHAYNVTLEQVAEAVRRSNLDVGARTLEINRVEYLVRGVGFVEGVADLEQIVVASRADTPVRVRDVARVGLGPGNRRGVLDKGGAEAVGGVVVARFGANPNEVIAAVKARIQELGPGLPRRTLEDGTTSQVRLVPFYDRTELIDETVQTLSTALLQQILITVLVVLVLLRHLRSAALISSMLPIAVLLTFLAMKATGVVANIMSLAGIAIAIGTMVDMGIVIVENIISRLDEVPPGGDRAAAVRQGAGEVAPAVLTSVATTVISFLPVFALTASEGKLFKPLAWTKTFALLAALGLAVTLLPPLTHLVIGPRSKDAGRDVQGLVRGFFQPAQGRHWLLLLVGAWLTWSGAIWVGIFAIVSAVLRLFEPWLRGRWRHLPTGAEVVLAVVGITAVLALEWLPLGPGAGLTRNLSFVALVVGVLLGGLLIFLKVYEPILRWTLEHKVVFLLFPSAFVIFGLSAWLGFARLTSWLPEGVRQHHLMVAASEALPGFGREFMPPFDEGAYLFMPTTMPHASMGEALEVLQATDAAIAQIPEVVDVVGKIGRVDSPLDPAPVSMLETVITYRPEYRIDADGKRVRQWRDHIRTPDDIWQEITRAATYPGLTGAPELMPINARIVMLQSGMRASMGIKVQGPDLETIAQVGLRLEELLKHAPSVRPETVFAERIVGKPYLEIEIDREALGRYGLTVMQVQRVIEVALGGKPLTFTVEGRARYPVRVRYMREERDSVEAISRVRVPTADGAQIPLEQLARITYLRGPQMIKAEDTFLTGYVIFDRQPDVAEADAVEQARAYLDSKLASGELVLPAGVRYSFAGAYENQLRSEERLKILVPLALILIVVLLYLQFRSLLITKIIYSGVLVAFSGGMTLLWLYAQPWFMDFELLGIDMRALFQVGPQNLSMAVWIGFIALVGVATDDGVVMATYLEQRFKASSPTSVAEIRAAVVDAGLRRVRPCLMTTATTLLALLPVVTSQGRGADVMLPMALPSLGGMAIELVTLFVVPVLYCWRAEARATWRQEIIPTATSIIDPDAPGARQGERLG